MRKSLHTFTLFGIIICLISSCSTSSDLANNSIIKKRRYSKGYQISVKGLQKDSKPTEKSTAKVEEIETSESEEKYYSEFAEAAISKEITDTDVVTTNEVWNVSDTSDSEDDGSESNHKKKALSDTRFGDEMPMTKKEFRKNIRSQKATSAAAASASDGSLVLYVILAILLPPLAVGLLYGIGTEFLISLILTILFWVPGVIYALIMVLNK